MIQSAMPGAVLAGAGLLGYGLALRSVFRGDDDKFSVYMLVADVLVLISNLISAVIEFLHHDDWWWFNATAVVVMILCIWRDWRKWKNRRKALKALGAKSRLLRDKLVQRVREGQQPRPVKVPI